MDLSEIPASELQAELEERKQRAQGLVRRYERLLEQTNKLRAEIEAQGGSVPGLPSSPAANRRIRPFNKESLANLMHRIVAGKSMSVDEVTQGVLDAGYKSSARSLRAIVNLTLIKDSRFKRVSRGVYTAKN